MTGRLNDAAADGPASGRPDRGLRLRAARRVVFGVGLAGAFFGYPGRLYGAPIPIPIPIPIPNGSFESPVTQYVNTLLEGWQKAPRPDNYNEGGGFLWTQLTGAFRNTPATSPDHIDNCEGAQALYLFAVPDVAVSLDREAVPAFDARFEVGKSYELTVGVIGAGGNMVEGGTLELSLYYLADAHQSVPVAMSVVTNRLEQFGNRTHFFDYQVRVPVVQPGQAWAGQPMGIRLRSTIDPEHAGGYWDLDNVRLNAVMEEPLQLSFRLEGPDLRISWASRAGYQYHVERTDELASWTAIAPTVTGTGETVSLAVSTVGRPFGFYRVIGTTTTP